MTREEALNDWLPIIRQMVKGTDVYEEALDMAIRALEKESTEMTAKESDNVKNSLMAIKATQKQSCEEEDVAKAFQLGLALGLEEKHNENEMDKEIKTLEDLENHCKENTGHSMNRLIHTVNLVNSSSEKPNKWIPCSERLPEIHQDVILSLRSLDVEVGYRAETEPYFYCHGADGCYIDPKNILAWMPLPEPYKQEVEE